jgi:hypothetical protein
MPRLPALLLLLPLLAAARAGETPAPVVPLAPVRVTADLWGTDLDRIPASVTVLDAPALAAGAVPERPKLETEATIPRPKCRIQS